MKLAILLILSGTAFGQGVRYDHKVTTVASNVPVGANAPVLAIPNATVSICSDGNCLSALPTVYSDQGLTVPTANPMKSNGQGNFGFWAAPGNYFYKVVLPSGIVVGIFPITLGGSGGGGGAVSSVFGRTGVVTPLSSDYSAFYDAIGAAATAQTNAEAFSANASNITSGTIGAARVPTLNQSTTGTAANLSGTPALPNGTTATTQTVGDNTTKIATDAFVLANASGSGNTTSTALTINRLPKSNGANSIIDSNISDDGTAMTYNGTGPGCISLNPTQICITAPPYNAVGDGTTDNTAAFLAAIAAIAALPGKTGTIWVPDGIYVVGTTLLDTGCANAVLPMPKIPFSTSGTLVDISIKGFNLPAWSSTPAGFILKSSLTTGNLIGGCDTAGTLPNFTNVKLEMENGAISLPVNTGAVAINASNILAFRGRHLLISTPGSGVTIPTNTAGGGIFMPQVLNEVQNELDDVNIAGFWKDYVITEHTHANHIHASYSQNCFVFDNGSTSVSVGPYTGNGASVSYLWEQNCVNGIVGVAGTFHNPLVITLAELENITGNGILDTANNLYGIINVNISNGIGPWTTTTCNAAVSGGTHLTIHYVQCQPEAPNVPIPPPITGMVEYWPSQEGQGTTLTNSGFDFTNKLTTTNVTWATAAGFTGNVATYNGTTSTSVATSAANTAFDGATPFSICVWAEPTTFSGLSDMYLLSNITSGANAGYTLEMWGSGISTGAINVNLYASISGSNDIRVNSAAGVATAGAINHVCFTYDGSKLAAGVKLYVNGVAVSGTVVSDTLSGGSIASSALLTIGSANGGTFGNFPGAIGYPQEFNRLLSASEVSALFAHGPNPY
jgi:hypothetical protein